MVRTTERQISSNEVTIGMYVSALDRPWVESPFAFQGFTIKSQSDIDLIQRSCEFVYVDVEQGHCPSEIGACQVSITTVPVAEQLTLDDITHHNTTSERSPTHEEFKRGQLAYAALERTFSDVMKTIQAGEQLNLLAIAKTLDPMIISIQQNPDALLQLLMLDGRQATLARDSITTAVLATTIGKRIGIKDKQLVQLALGGLLYDVGKLALPQELLDQPRQFTPAEFKVVKGHVAEGVEILNKALGSQPKLIAMAQHHHERYNGSGYPSQIERDNIPIFARIASIVDCFNAITSHRPHAPAMSPYHAALKLYEWKEVDFDPQLVEQLIQVIGVYPIGSPVELNSGEIAVVVAHNKAQRLKPVVAVLRNSEKEELARPRIVDLAQKPVDASGEPILLKHAVESGVYELNLNGVLETLYENDH